MLSTSSSHQLAYKSIVQGTKQILRVEGPKGLFRGLSASTLGVTHGAFQFMIYENLKKSRVMAATETGSKISNLELLAYSALSKGKSVNARARSVWHVETVGELKICESCSSSTTTEQNKCSPIPAD